MTDTQFIRGPNGQIAYEWVGGDSTLPPIVFLHGFKSDMAGSKAEFLKSYCLQTGRDFLRFDMNAHGRSAGDFMHFTIGKALADTEFMIGEALCHPAIIIGSSMGGWIGLRLLQTMPQKIHGYIGIAAAPNFTRKISNALTDEQQKELRENGFITEDSGYAEPYIFTQKLFDDGENHCLLDQAIEYNGPVHLIQGKQDTSVDWRMPEAIRKCFSHDIKITLIDDGDHSLSRESDLNILKSAVEEMSS
jgi:hypothetical protein